MIRKDLVLVALMIAILALMVVPLNSAIIDVLIVVNMSLAVLLLMVAIYLKQPSDFSTFPSVILIGTAFRLALSIGTTRLILSEADGGKIIETFGDFVVGGSVAIGLVIFLIITVVQFLVVTKGAERVAEVGARFALDALPGKQMSIDADVRAGNIEQDEATILRAQLNRDSQFFGAMDGAMKFVKGDAIAGLIIIIINLIGGVAVGVSIHGLSIGEAVSVYSLLTIGDGLVAQIPALIMSLCAGVIVTRAANSDNADLGSDIFKELIADPRVPGMAALVLFIMGFIPGFPLPVFMGASIILLLAALTLRRAYATAQATDAAERALSKEADAETDAGPAAADHEPTSDRLIAYIGRDLANSLALDVLQATTTDAFGRLRRARGIAFPTARIEVSDHVDPWDLIIELDEVPVLRRTIPSGMMLVEGGVELLEIDTSTDPAISKVDWPDLVAFWVPLSMANSVAALKLNVLGIEQKVGQLLYRIYEQHLGILFSTFEFDEILTAARELDPDGVTNVEAKLSRTALFQVMRNLVEDGVPIRPLGLVLDALVYWTHVNEGAGPLLISEGLRGSLKRQLCHSIAGQNNVLGVAMLDPELEDMARQGLADAKRSGTLSSLEGLIFAPEVSERLLGKFMQLQHANASSNHQLAIIASTDIRRRLRNYLAANRIHLPVLAPHEISPDVQTYPVEFVSLGKKVAQVEPPQKAAVAAE